MQAAPWKVPTSAAVIAGALGVVAFASVGFLGVRQYVDNYLQYRGFAPPREPAYVTAPGTLHRILVPSPALGGRRQEVYVYLPSGYAGHPAQRYPVLYLLHGFPGRPLAFIETVQMGIIDDSLTATGKAQPLILVMPFGSTGTFTDQEWSDGVGHGNGWATFVSRDVVRFVDSHYRTIRSSAGRAIGGLSEGGYGAINIALEHPGEFRVVESWSGYEKPARIPQIYGSHLQLLARNDPLTRLPAVARGLRSNRTYFWFYSGSRDHFRVQNAAFARALAVAGIRHRYFQVFGGHNWAIWRDQARDAYIAAASRLAHG